MLLMERLILFMAKYCFPALHFCRLSYVDYEIVTQR